MPIQKYIDEVKKLHATGHASEHSYRPALQNCLTGFLKNVQVTNEPRRQLFGAPDYILMRNDITVGWIEAKDIGKDLDKVEKGSKDDDQWERYTDAQPNIVLTDYLEFRFFTDGIKNEIVRIGEVQNGKIVPLPENFPRFEALFKDFGAFQGQTIKSARKLAEMMAAKAALMRDVFLKVVESNEPSVLKDQLSAFKEVLMHNMDEAQFADVYAQTIAYGLFTARLHDKTLSDFSRGEALTLIPKTNPFLQKLFQYVAGADLDTGISWIVDALCEVFRAADLGLILKDFGSTTGRNDPILHFYETFLAEYNPTLREVRGVYYTPEPVVQFIVRAVDDVLKDHFGLKDGLADTSKTKIQIAGQEVDNRTKTGRKIEEREVHKVQILDIATGTGTFLAEIVKQIYAKFKGQEGLWGNYVTKDLIPRMHGFELLVASYAMCHMKLDLLLKETGYDLAKAPSRLSVYLTNSLEEHHKDSHLPFANWLSTEANEASRIKRDMPIMVAIGNPPYSGISQNMGSWIAQNKIDDYKYVDGVHFNERKHWLNDDYVQFIRLGEHYIEKNGEGVLAYITNHGYLDNPTFRGMRWHLMSTFDEIYVLDLHGNANKKEISPDGTPDKNVFDIRQGVAIIIALKTKATDKKKPLAKVYHAELWGGRDSKYERLETGKLKEMNFKKLDTPAPLYFFIPQNYDDSAEYESGFSLSKLFPVNVTGIVTSRDGFVIGDDRESLIRRIKDFCDKSMDTPTFQSHYHLKENYQWKCAEQRKLIPDFDEKNFQKITYRPFDERNIYYQTNLVFRMREGFMNNFLHGDNVGLILSKRVEIPEFSHVFVSSQMIQHHTMSLKEVNISFPLYTYEKIGNLEEKRSNLDPKIYAAIKKIVPKVTPESVFDYIYAVLHSPAYRKRYAEFLRSDFPRIPYPKDVKTFDALAKLGGEIRALHLMESKTLEGLITSYPVGGDHEVVKARWEDTDKKQGLGKVWINTTQYFDHVPKTAWEFYIGGYQPAQKWLKDRQGRNLSADDIKHYQRIIVALTQTDRLMQEIDQIDFLPKGK
jgi:predicted helicase